MSGALFKLTIDGGIVAETGGLEKIAVRVASTVAGAAGFPPRVYVRRYGELAVVAAVTPTGVEVTDHGTTVQRDGWPQWVQALCRLLSVSNPVFIESHSPEEDHDGN